MSSTNYQTGIQTSPGKGIKYKKASVAWKSFWSNRYLFALFLPGLLYFIVFKYGAMYGLLMAFQNYSFKLGITGSTWVGLKNFEYLMSAPDFLTVLINTLRISLLKLFFGFPAPIILALMLNEIRSKAFLRISQSITYLPHFFSWVVLGGLVMGVLSPSAGIVNKIIMFCGGEPIYFLANKHWFVPILILSDIWKEVGWGSIIYLAALTSISPELYEAAIVDSATRWQRMIHITLPCIVPTIIVVGILRVGHILEAGFDQIFNLYNPSVYEVADVLDTYMYRIGVGGYKYSLTTAAGLFKAIIGLLLVLMTNSFAKRISQGENGLW